MAAFRRHKCRVAYQEGAVAEAWSYTKPDGTVEVHMEIIYRGTYNQGVVVLHPLKKKRQ